MDAIQKILVPTDFSAHADEAFRVAHMLARAIGAEVILFHVAQPPAVVSEGGQLLANPPKGDAINLWDASNAFSRPIPTSGCSMKSSWPIDPTPGTSLKYSISWGVT